MSKLADERPKIDPRNELASHWQKWRAEKRKRVTFDHGKGVNSTVVFAAMNRHLPENAVIAVDVGDNAYSFGRYFGSLCKTIEVVKKHL